VGEAPQLSFCRNRHQQHGGEGGGEGGGGGRGFVELFGRWRCVYDETESCGSAANFLLGAAINDGKDDQMEGGLDGEIGPELDLNEEGVGVDLFLHDLSVSAAKNNDLEMKVASHLRTQAALKKSHESTMAELMLSHRSKVDELTSTHAFNLDVEKKNLCQRISSERKLLKKSSIGGKQYLDYL
jgi:hypothetical protein